MAASALGRLLQMGSRILFIVLDVVAGAEVVRLLIENFGALSSRPQLLSLAERIAALDLPIEKSFVTPAGGVLPGGALGTAIAALALGWLGNTLVTRSRLR